MCCATKCAVTQAGNQRAGEQLAAEGITSHELGENATKTTKLEPFTDEQEQTRAKPSSDSS